MVSKTLFALLQYEKIIQVCFSKFFNNCIKACFTLRGPVDGASPKWLIHTVTGQPRRDQFIMALSTASGGGWWVN